jgi:hypothetical protein
VFVQPLYIPEDAIVLNFGKRLEFGFGRLTFHERWDLNPDSLDSTLPAMLKSMFRQGVPFLRKRDSIELFIRNLKYGIRVENTIFDREALVYSLARLGRYREAERRLKSLIRSIKPDDLRQDVHGNANELLTAIQTSPNQAHELLNRWTEETARNLRLPLQDVESARKGS